MSKLNLSLSSPRHILQDLGAFKFIVLFFVLSENYLNLAVLIPRFPSNPTSPSLSKLSLFSLFYSSIVSLLNYLLIYVDKVFPAELNFPIYKMAGPLFGGSPLGTS